MDEKSSKTDMYYTMLNNLRALNFEAKERKEELDTIKRDIKEYKSIYNQKIKEYNDLMHTLLQKEQLQEKTHKLINKYQSIQSHLYHQITPRFIIELNDTIKYIPSPIANSFINFCGFTSYFTIDFLIKINKTPEDWLDLLQMISMKNCSENHLTKITATNDLPSSFILLIDYCNSIIDINEIKSNMILENKEIDQLIDLKNASFLHLKKIESDIIHKDCMYRNIIRYIKGIYSLFDRYNKIKASNSNTSVNQSAYIDLFKAINNYKKINILNGSNVFDYMNHSTLKSEFSEEMSYISFQTNDFSMNQSKSNIGLQMTTTMENIQLPQVNNLTKAQVLVEGRVLNSEMSIPDISKNEENIVNMNKYQSPDKIRGFQQISAILTQKCSEGKLHKKQLDDDDDKDYYEDKDNDDFNEDDNNNNNVSSNKSEFIPTEDHEIRKVRQILFNKGKNNITKEINEGIRNDDYCHNHLYTDDNECDMINKTDTDFKYLKHINSFAVQPSKMAQDNHLGYSKIKKSKKHDQFFDMTNESQFCCTTACT